MAPVINYVTQLSLAARLSQGSAALFVRVYQSTCSCQPKTPVAEQDQGGLNCHP
jgi:hypothetical protein